MVFWIEKRQMQLHHEEMLRAARHQQLARQLRRERRERRAERQ